jgi:hypothetical protein
MRNGINPAIPCRAVGRVLRGTGDGHTSKHLVVAFDYGTETMVAEEFAFNDENMKAVRQFDDTEEYVNLLETHKIEFAKKEAEFDKAKKSSGKKKAKKKVKKRTKKQAKKST